MKIGIDIRSLMDARYSGVSEYALNLIYTLLEQDKENEYRLFYNSFHQVSDRLPEFSAENVKIIERKYPNKVFNYLLQKSLNWPKIDRLLGVDLFFMPHLNFISLSGKAKIVIAIHDLSFLRYPEFFSWRKNFWHRMLNVKKILQKTDCIIAVSENTKSDIVALCGVPQEKIRVIYSGINSIYDNYQPEDDQKSIIRKKYNLPSKYILFLGTIEPRKNIKGLIEAYGKFRNKNSELAEYKLVLAGGKGWKAGAIYIARNNSKYKNDIVFLDYIKAEDKPVIYSLASLFVYPSFYEGFGFPPLEAMACGTPVITSFSSSLSEIAGDAALLVDPYNTTDIASTIGNLLNNENLRLSLKNKGLIQAKKFNWLDSANKYLELFKSLV
jgi:glycosyltransferase involved in cell wall biosynthesis